jgi:hypothetical protein
MMTEEEEKNSQMSRGQKLLLDISYLNNNNKE